MSGLDARIPVIASGHPLFVHGEGVIVCDRCKVRWEQMNEPVRVCPTCGGVPSIYDDGFRRAMELWDNEE